jgi:SET domain-containing protein
MEPNLIFIVLLLLTTGLLAGIPIGMHLKKRALVCKRGRVAIGASSISGRGAFSTEHIRDGDIIERCPAIEVDDRDIGGELLNYVFYGSEESSRLVVMGYGMLFNHSSVPNVAYYLEQTALGPELVIYALRNIRKGEELFYNYGDDWWKTRGR